MMDLSIAIVNWNTRDLLARCLVSILETSEGFDCEVVVVDNASTDGSADMVRQDFPWVKLIENSDNVGFARANNQAIEQIAGRYVLLLNSDTVVLTGALEKMVHFMDQYPNAGIVGATLLNPDGSFQASRADFPSLLSDTLLVTGLASVVCTPYFPSYPPPQHNSPQLSDWVGGACLMARREAVVQVGLLDEAYFFYAEEMDLCYRMRENGWQVYHLPEARVIHLGGQSISKQLHMKRVYQYRSKIHFYQKHYGRTRLAYLKGLVSMSSLALVVLWLPLCLLRGGDHYEARQALNSNLRLVWDCWT